jgi:hypothetical protein
MIWEAGAIVFVRSLADLEMKKERERRGELLGVVE